MKKPTAKRWREIETKLNAEKKLIILNSNQMRKVNIYGYSSGYDSGFEKDAYPSPCNVVLSILSASMAHNTYYYEEDKALRDMTLRQTPAGVRRSAGDIYKIANTSLEQRHCHYRYSFKQIFNALMDLCKMGIIGSFVCGDIHKRVYRLKPIDDSQVRQCQDPDKFDEFNIKPEDFGVKCNAAVAKISYRATSDANVIY